MDTRISPFSLKSSNNSQKGFVLVGVIAGIIAVLVAGGVGYVLYKTSEKDPNPSQEKQQTETEEQKPKVNNPFPPKPPEEPAMPTVNMSGKWTGNYKVNGPELCNEESGTWEARITQTPDNMLYGTYSSGAVSGNISGNVTETKGFTWTVTGGGGAKLTGTVTGQNSVSGGFTGPTCPSSTRTYGTFFGGRVKD